MTIREIESGSDIMEVNRLAGLIWHEAYRGIVSREQIAYMIERFQSVRAITEQLALEGYRYFLMEDEGRAVGYCGVQPRDGRLFLSKVYLLHEARGQGRFRGKPSRHVPRPGRCWNTCADCAARSAHGRSGSRSTAVTSGRSAPIAGLGSARCVRR